MDEVNFKLNYYAIRLINSFKHPKGRGGWGELGDKKLFKIEKLK